MQNICIFIDEGAIEGLGFHGKIGSPQGKDPVKKGYQPGKGIFNEMVRTVLKDVGLGQVDIPGGIVRVFFVDLKEAIMTQDNIPFCQMWSSYFTSPCFNFS